MVGVFWLWRAHLCPQLQLLFCLPFLKVWVPLSSSPPCGDVYRAHPSVGEWSIWQWWLCFSPCIFSWNSTKISGSLSPALHAGRLRRQESGLSELNPGRHLGLTKPETRRAEKWEECTVAISPCFLRLTSVLNCFHVFCSTLLLIDTCNSAMHLFKYISRVY